MADYSSPLRRKSTYSSPSSRSFINHPPPEGSLRDTTINVATAFSNAEQTRQYTRSPQFQSLSNHTSHLGNNYILSPSQRLSKLKRNSDNHGTLVDSDNEFFGQIKSMDLYGQQASSLSQSSSSEDELDDNPYEEEELLALNPSEEEHRRGLIQKRSSTSDRFFSNYGSNVTGSSFHSFVDNSTQHQHQHHLSNNNNNDNHIDSTQQSAHESTTPLPSPRPRIQLALERTFEIIMFWVFMVFWVIKEVVVALFTFLFIVVSSFLVNPIVFVLQLIGFRSLEPLELPQLKSSFNRVAGADENHPSRLLTTYSTKRKVAILVVIVLCCFYWSSTGSHSDADYTHHLQQNSLHRLYSKLSQSPSSVLPSHWFPSSTANFQSPMTTNQGDLPTLHYDASMKDRFTTLEKTVHGLINHMEKQDQNSQQQIKTINYHLDQLQHQLSQWSSGQPTQMESSLMEQMDKVEKVLAATTSEMEDRLQQWESQIEQKHSFQEKDVGTVSPKLIETLRQLFVSKSNDDGEQWTTFLQHNKALLDQHIQDMMDEWIQEQQRQGKWVDMDTLNETLMAQLMHAYDDNNNNKNDGAQPKVTPETNSIVRSLIDTAIQKYHQDVLGTPDYALATRGAMVLTSYTSATFSPVDSQKRKQLWWWTQWYSQWSQMQVSPVVALTPGTHAGQCWPMKGDHGSLGIQLSEPIAVQAVTVEYPSRSVVANHVSSAPKEFEVWGIKHIDKKKKRTVDDDDDEGTNTIFLGSFTYDIKSSASPVQTFSLDTNRYIVLQGVVVRVRSNWGNHQFTCLYRIRVHGTPAV
ncbi:UNC-like C-terminal-domain-containing protein [Absidia repens]|uniref:UNC-like C-terminal-domain-containing protein n=1 Tax=Absidia repens TaxID=90262 RepID=A0A1X2IUW7_9FUNG|nr:UNC-like C-terminal-domain-containing protein [Absidia repens]